MIRGITVTLYETTATGSDPFGAQIVTEQAVEVDDVLVGEPTTEEMLASTQLYGKEIKYMLGIPKGDTHDWKDKKVSWTDAYGETHVCRTYGFPITGIEENIPTKWHKKVRCTDYE